MPEAHPKEKTVQSVERTLRIIEIMADRGQPMTLSEITSVVGLKISTVHRLLKTLIIRGFAMQDPYTGKYQLGIKTFHVGNNALYALDIRVIARPYLKKLAEISYETVNLAILDQGYVVYIDQVESDRMVRMVANLGSRVPSHSNAVGKVLLNSLSEIELERFLNFTTLEKFTPNTLTSPEKIKNVLKQVKQKGYALDLEETEVGIRCAAAPIFNHKGKLCSAIGISGPASRISVSFLKGELALYVKETAMEVSSELGFLSG